MRSWFLLVDTVVVKGTSVTQARALDPLKNGQATERTAAKKKHTLNHVLPVLGLSYQSLEM